MTAIVQKNSTVKGRKFKINETYEYEAGVMETSGNRDGWFAFVNTEDGMIQISEKRFRTIFNQEL